MVRKPDDLCPGIFVVYGMHALPECRPGALPMSAGGIIPVCAGCCAR
jgi:hypothetical protein